MDSRIFIKQARSMIADMEAADILDNLEQKKALQRELNQLFGGLQNPTLPSAYRLRDVALRLGYGIAPVVLQRLALLEHVS